MKNFYTISLCVLMGAAIAFAYHVLFALDDTITVDNTEVYQKQIDSLKTSNLMLKRKIEFRDERIAKEKAKSNALLEYQTKIYKYYENEKKKLSSLSDSSHAILFLERTR